VRLSTVTLERDGQRLTLQGMIHLGTYALYRKLQRELDRERKLGATLFFEMIMVSGEPADDLSEIARDLLAFFRPLPYGTKRIPATRKVPYFASQKNQIDYRLDEDINADSSAEELLRLADQYGVFAHPRMQRPLRWLRLFLRLVRSRQYNEADRAHTAHVPQTSSSQKKRVSIVVTALQLLIGCLVRWLMLRSHARVTAGIDPVLDPVLLTERNHIAVDTIEQYFAEQGVQRGYVHYGEAHIPGLVELFEQRGWQVAERQQRNLAWYVLCF